MNKTAIIAILIVSALLIGCAKSEIEAMSEKEYEKVKEAADNLPEAPKTYTVTETKTESGKTYTSTEGADTKELQVKDSSTGETVTLQKKEIVARDRQQAEVCNMDYPLECSDYLAKDGIIYITIKNVGYDSKLDQVTLSLDNDVCDPSETYIETGQNKDFECYSDASSGEMVSGELEMEYYKKIGSYHDSQTGVLNVMME